MSESADFVEGFVEVCRSYFGESFLIRHVLGWRLKLHEALGKICLQKWHFKQL